MLSVQPPFKTQQNLQFSHTELGLHAKTCRAYYSAPIREFYVTLEASAETDCALISVTP